MPVESATPTELEAALQRIVELERSLTSATEALLTTAATLSSTTAELANVRAAFCLSTDATGVAIQPERLAAGKRQACGKGHFFVVLADKVHVFFEYQAKHTSDAVCSMFRGFKGYIQADAHCVYDALFRGDARIDETDKPPDEVGCWAHARRNSGRPPSRPRSRRLERHSFVSGCSSNSKRTGAASRRASDTNAASA